MPEHRSSCVDAQQQVFRCRLVILSQSDFSLLAAYVAIDITDFFNDIASYLGPLLSLGREHNVCRLYHLRSHSNRDHYTTYLCYTSLWLHSTTPQDGGAVLPPCLQEGGYVPQVDGLPTVRALASHIKDEIIQRPPLYN
jgi:hypothetical protein